MQSNYLPPLEPIGDFRSYVCGNVVIDQTAAIASGVLIQADQGGQITIAAGVCIGMGAVLHAQDGLLEICTGANLGAGVLVYGNSKIGEGACIGASSSIVHAVIARGVIVPPCSLISGLSQGTLEKEVSPAIAQELNQNSNSVSVPTAETTTDDQGQTHVHNDTGDASDAASETSETVSPESNGEDLVSSSPIPDISTLATANSAQAKAFAQSQINRFIKRLYPQN
ncbi:MAG: hypothetical protein DCE90_12040 [Pseudanabaena sp.]|nr:MAG: hypothetical protein DCE90_12040 [Pseudanabaena sp.]